MEGKDRNGHGTFAFSPLSAVNLARWSFGPAEDDVSLPLAQEGKRHDAGEEREKTRKKTREEEVAIFSVDSERASEARKRAPSLCSIQLFSFPPRPGAVFCLPTSAWARAGHIASDRARSAGGKKTGSDGLEGGEMGRFLWLLRAPRPVLASSPSLWLHDLPRSAACCCRSSFSSLSLAYAHRTHTCTPLT